MSSFRKSMMLTKFFHNRWEKRDTMSLSTTCKQITNGQLLRRLRVPTGAATLKVVSMQGSTRAFISAFFRKSEKHSLPSLMNQNPLISMLNFKSWRESRRCAGVSLRSRGIVSIKQSWNRWLKYTSRTSSTFSNSNKRAPTMVQFSTLKTSRK